VNLAEWSSHLLERLHHQCEATANPELIKQYHELKSYPMQRAPARCHQKMSRSPSSCE